MATEILDSDDETGDRSPSPPMVDNGITSFSESAELAGTTPNNGPHPSVNLSIGSTDKLNMDIREARRALMELTPNTRSPLDNAVSSRDESPFTSSVKRRKTMRTYSSKSDSDKIRRSTTGLDSPNAFRQSHRQVGSLRSQGVVDRNWEGWEFTGSSPSDDLIIQNGEESVKVKSRNAKRSIQASGLQFKDNDYHCDQGGDDNAAAGFENSVKTTTINRRYLEAVLINGGKSAQQRSQADDMMKRVDGDGKDGLPSTLQFDIRGSTNHERRDHSDKSDHEQETWLPDISTGRSEHAGTNAMITTDWMPPPLHGYPTLFDPLARYPGESSTIPDPTPAEETQKDTSEPHGSRSTEKSSFERAMASSPPFGISTSMILDGYSNRAREPSPTTNSRETVPARIVELDVPSSSGARESSVAMSGTPSPRLRRKRRTKTTMGFIPQPVNDTDSDDEIALSPRKITPKPIVVHETMAKNGVQALEAIGPRRLKGANQNRPADELGSEDNEIPVEQYKPRPSRSRAAKAPEMDLIDFSRRPEARPRARRKKTVDMESQELHMEEASFKVNERGPSAERGVSIVQNEEPVREEEHLPKVILQAASHPPHESAASTRDAPSAPSKIIETESNHAETRSEPRKAQSQADRKTSKPSTQITQSRKRRKTQEEDPSCTKETLPEEHLQPTAIEVSHSRLVEHLETCPPPPLVDSGEKVTSIHQPDPEPETTSKTIRAHPPLSPSNQPKTSDQATPETPTSKPKTAHSPIQSGNKVPYRVGLSKRARIQPLLRSVRK
ncbi:MAG: hypothetical protein M1819_001500 [Sarea resinae]|nr:MAG: hypothetical protein M1819_001500 [Sarea resinae]